MELPSLADSNGSTKHLSGLVQDKELPMHVSAGPLRSVPGYAFPFTEQTEHIQKRARPQSRRTALAC